MGTESKAGGDPEIIALAKMTHKNIVVTLPNGHIKTYFEDGKIIESTERGVSNRAIHLSLQQNDKTGIGHITLAGTTSTNDADNRLDCLYQAVKQATKDPRDTKAIRNEIAVIIERDCKQFYHDWSLASEPKEFVGIDPFDLNRRFIAGLHATGTVAELTLSAALIAGSAGSALPAWGLALHSADNLTADLMSIFTGKEHEPHFVNFLQTQFHYSKTEAHLFNDYISAVGSLGATAALKAAEVNIANATRKAAAEAMKVGRPRLKPIGNTSYEHSAFRRDRFTGKITHYPRNGSSRWQINARS